MENDVACERELWKSVAMTRWLTRVFPLLACATLGAWSATGLAQDIDPDPRACPPGSVGCHRVDVDFEHRDALFDDVSFDTGWVPAGAPVQVRFGLFLGGSTEVDLGGTVVTSWPPGLEVRVPGRPGTGRLAINYGFEIIARIRFDVSVAGVRYRWEGDIPLPGGVPRDLRLADTLEFDPFVLPGAMPRPVAAWDDTDMVRVFEVDLTDAIIPIPGIGGGFTLEAVAELEGTYRTERIEVGDAIAPIFMENAPTVVRPDPGAAGFGAAKDTTVLPVGILGYEGVIRLLPGLFIEVAGRRFDLTLADIPIPVADLESETRFEPAEVHVPLPDVRVDPSFLGFGEVPVGGAAERLLSVHNDGEAELRVSVREPVAPFSRGAATLVVPPRSSARLIVGYAPEAPGDRAGVLLLDTNDPDAPLVTVRLGGAGLGDAMGDGGYADAGVGDGGAGPFGPSDGGCGCRASGEGHGGAAWLLVPLLGIGLRRASRRRRGSASSPPG